MDQTEKYIANAVLGIDTLWGGDVMCASGTGRFIADSWFSDEPLPLAYTAPAAAKLRECGGVYGEGAGPQPWWTKYLREVDIPAAIAGMKHERGRDGRPAWPLPGQPVGLPDGDVGLGHGDPGQRPGGAV